MGINPASRSRVVVTPSSAWRRWPAIEWTWLCTSTKPGPTTCPVTSTTSASRVLLPIARERRPDGDDLPAVDHDVSHPLRPGARVHDQSTAKNQHSFIQLQSRATLIG